MDTTDPIDYDQLNHAAQRLYDDAKAVGQRLGEQQAVTVHATRLVVANVDLAVNLLEHSVQSRDKLSANQSGHTRLDDQWAERRFAVMASLVLNRTPAYADVSKAGHDLARARIHGHPKGVDRKQINETLAHLKAYLEHLGGYR